MIDAVCEGDPWEMGFAQGQALREKIAAARDALRKLEAFRLGQPGWMPYQLYRRLAERKAAKFLAVALSNCPGEPVRRLAGVAAGARLRRESICLFTALEPLLSSVNGKTEIPALGACSAVALRGGHSATGEPIVARNFDYLPVFQPYYVVLENRPAGKKRSLAFTMAPLCGTVDGMNESGLCIAYDYAFATDQQRPAPLISMLITEALGRFATVSEGAEWIGSQPRVGAGLLMMADAGGDIASLELSNSRSALRRPKAGEDFLFHSNAYATETMREVEIHQDATWTKHAPSLLRGRNVLQSSVLRDRRFAQLLTERTGFGPHELAALMSDHGPSGQPSADSICMHSDYWNTTACLQLMPRSRRMRVAYDAACRAQYVEVELC